MYVNASFILEREIREREERGERGKRQKRGNREKEKEREWRCLNFKVVLVWSHINKVKILYRFRNRTVQVLEAGQISSELTKVLVTKISRQGCYMRWQILFQINRLINPQIHQSQTGGLFFFWLNVHCNGAVLRRLFISLRICISLRLILNRYGVT